MKSNEISRGWLLILSSCAGVICSVVVLPYYSNSALLSPVTEALGWERSEFLFATFFSAGFGIVTAPIVGWLCDKYGSRRVAIPALFGLSSGFFLAASMNGELWVLYVAYSLMGILGAGTIPVTWTRGIVSNFSKQRGLALGLTLTGTGICAMAMPPYIVWLIAEFGWRGAYIGLGLLPLVLALPLVVLWFKPREARSDNVAAASVANPAAWGLTLGEAVRTFRFWVLLFSILAVYMAVSGISPNLMAKMTDGGFSGADAASVMSLLGAAIIIGRVAIGFLVDRFWAPGVAMVSMLLPVIGCYIFIGEPGLQSARLAALLIGFAAGAELDLMSFLAAKYFGTRHYGKIYSILYATLAFGSATAPFLFGMVFDKTGNYDVGFYAALVMFALSAILVLLLGRYPIVSAQRDADAEAPA